METTNIYRLEIFYWPSIRWWATTGNFGHPYTPGDCPRQHWTTQDDIMIESDCDARVSYLERPPRCLAQKVCSCFSTVSTWTSQSQECRSHTESRGHELSSPGQQQPTSHSVCIHVDAFYRFINW